MRTIEVDEDIYSYLASKTMHIGESASSILRRELKLSGSASLTKSSSSQATHELSEFLDSSRIKLGNATDRFLAVLGEAHRSHRKDFEHVLSIQGRDRVYFARSRDEIAQSGKSTQPLQIPNTEYWVMTNSPTSQKRKMLRQALQLLGYSERAIAAAASTIV